MQPINAADYIRFTNALNQNVYLSCKNGQWQRDNAFTHFIRWLFGWETDRLKAIVKEASKALDQQESQPFHNDASDHYTTINLTNLVHAVEGYVGSEEDCQKGIKELKLKLISMQYRMRVREPHGVKFKLREDFRKLVLAWKQHDPLFDDKTLQPTDLAKIEQFCQYSEFAQFLVENPKLAYHQLKVGIRDNIDVQALVEYNHHVTEILYQSHMTCRIGRFARRLLSVKEGSEKRLELLIRGAPPVDISDHQNIITFSNGLKVTVQSIFDSFRKLNSQPSSGEYEFFIDGLAPWNGHEWGAKKVGEEGYDSIDVTQERFWERPDFPIYDIALKTQIEHQYKIKIQDPKSSVQVLESTRTTRGVGLEGHGYTLFYIPTGDGVTYKVIPLGLYANKFPVSSLENVSFIADTVPGTIVFPDPNYTYTRQKASIAEEISDKKLEMQMRRIAVTRINGGWFMWSWENCCHYSKKLFMNVITHKPKLHSIIKKRTFKVLFLESRPDQWFLAFIHKGYRICQLPYLKSIYEQLAFMILGTSRKLKVREIVFENGQERVLLTEKSTQTSKFCKSVTNNLPAKFHDRVEKGEIPGAVLSYGHGRNG